MICEMCGSEKNKLLLVDVDGALLKVCPNCARFGKGKQESKDVEMSSMSTPVNKMPSFKKKKEPYSKDVFDKMGDDELIEGYGRVIRESRMALNMSQEDLARKVGVRRETIVFLEQGKYNPSLKLAHDVAKSLRTTIDELFIF